MVVGVNNKYQMQSEMESEKVGRILCQALLKAGSEQRLMAGLKNAIDTLAQFPEKILFCVMAVTSGEMDSATHINQVLLEAFCYEHDIYVLKVDSASKLGRVLANVANVDAMDKVNTCCLIQRDRDLTDEDSDSEDYDSEEEELVDYCEANWNAPQLPIVQLP